MLVFRWRKTNLKNTLKNKNVETNSIFYEIEQLDKKAFILTDLAY